MLFLLCIYLLPILAKDCTTNSDCNNGTGATKYFFCNGICEVAPCFGGLCSLFNRNPPTRICNNIACSGGGGFGKRSDEGYPCFFSECDADVCVPRNCAQTYQCLRTSDCNNTGICLFGICKPFVSCTDNFDCNVAADELCINNTCKIVSCRFRHDNRCPLSQSSVKGCFNPFCNENAHCQAINCSAQGSGGENESPPSFSPFLIFILISVFIMLLIILLVLWCARRKAR